MFHVITDMGMAGVTCIFLLYVFFFFVPVSVLWFK